MTHPFRQQVRFTPHPVAVSVARALASMAILSVPAWAQTAPTPDESTIIQKVEVTGSSIKRLASETALPIQSRCHHGSRTADQNFRQRRRPDRWCQLQRQRRHPARF
jgi:hypothetical protein